MAEKRATFALHAAARAAADARSRRACSPAGDYVDGPYPATLEGAVRSGVARARSDRRPFEVRDAELRMSRIGHAERARSATITIQVLERAFGLLDLLAVAPGPGRR